MVLNGGVARAFHLNMVAEAVSRKLQPMIRFTFVMGFKQLNVLRSQDLTTTIVQQKQIPKIIINFHFF